jgi:hypothetical protein
MSRNGLYGHLVLNKQLLEVAGARFATLTDGLDHLRIDTARDRLRASAEDLTRAAGGHAAALLGPPPLAGAVDVPG